MSSASSSSQSQQRSQTEPVLVRWLLTAVALLFLTLFLLLPLAAVFSQAFEKGLLVYLEALKEPDTLSSIKLTLITAAVSVPLNLFFGVPHVGEQYLPDHFAYLGSYFRRAPVTGFFFLTMGLSAGTWIWLVAEAQRSATELSTGWVLLASLLGLAIVEHVLMVFALPLQRLWGWALQAKPDHV